MATNKRTKFMDELMAEPIRLPGAPDLIVTRGWCYQWLVKLGYPTNTGGFNSADYMSFRRPMVAEPLTDITQPWAVAFISRMEQDLAS